MFQVFRLFRPQTNESRAWRRRSAMDVADSRQEGIKWHRLVIHAEPKQVTVSMAANSWDNNRVHAKKAQLQQHVFGATLGGPIVRNKKFFFGDYQGFLRNRPFDAITTVAPDAWRRGDFSDLRDSAGGLVIITDPSTGQPFPGNIIDPGRFSPVARALLSNSLLYPLANRPGDSNNLVTRSSDKVRTHQGDVKVDAISRSSIASLHACRTRATRQRQNERRCPAIWRQRAMRPFWDSPATGVARWARVF